MKIPEELFKRWEELKSKEDVNIMVSKNPNTSPLQYYRVWRTGICNSTELFRIIADFYRTKEELVNEYLKGTTKGK